MIMLMIMMILTILLITKTLSRNNGSPTRIAFWSNKHQGDLISRTRQHSHYTLYTLYRQSPGYERVPFLRLYVIRICM